MRFGSKSGRSRRRSLPSGLVAAPAPPDGRTGHVGTGLRTSVHRRRHPDHDHSRRASRRGRRSLGKDDLALLPSWTPGSRSFSLSSLRPGATLHILSRERREGRADGPPGDRFVPQSLGSRPSGGFGPEAIRHGELRIALSASSPAPPGACCGLPASTREGTWRAVRRTRSCRRGFPSRDGMATMGPRPPGASSGPFRSRPDVGSSGATSAPVDRV